MDDLDDLDLVELAAKAAGLPECGWMGPAFLYVKDNTFTEWNPLEDDGDALRLVVSLNLHILRFETMTTVRKIGADWGCDERDDGDPNAATRRAIVRAAAEFGKAKP